MRKIRKKAQVKMRINFWKALEVFAIGLIITSGVIAIQIYYNVEKGTCTSNPLVYAAKMYEERTGVAFVGSGYFITRDASPTVSFSSHGVLVTYPKDYLKNPNITLRFSE